MAIRRIILDGDSLLRKRSRAVENFDKRLHTLIDDMWETMYKADGVGLAAPQVATLKRVAVVDTCEGDKIEMINPEIVYSEGVQIGKEGCLSVPDFQCEVARPQKIKVRMQNRYGDAVEFEAEGFFAVACCHEIDHLDGILFKDKQYFDKNDKK